MTTLYEKEGRKPYKAYRNADFLNSVDARAIRVQCEFTEPSVRFKKYGVNHTVVFFGSARIKDPAIAEENLKKIEKELQHLEKPTPEQVEQLEFAKTCKRTSPYYGKARELACKLTKWSLSIEDPAERFHIITGGGPGIMEAANRGTADGGGRPIGMNITLPDELDLNPYCDREVSFFFHYFFVRKYWLFYLSKALVVFPGGFGTLDELFEILTLLKTKKTTKYVPIVLFGSDFWNTLFNFKGFLDWGVVTQAELDMFKIIDDVDEANEYLIRELTSHYINR